MFALTEEQQAVQASVRRFARREVRWKARKLDASPPGTVDWELLRKSCDVGLISAQLPPHYGGTRDRLTMAIALEEIAHWDGGTAALFAANSLAQQAVVLSENTTLADQLCADIVAKEEAQTPMLGAYALTERQVGSDLLHPDVTNPAAMMVLAKRRGDAYVLSGRKAYCAGGNIAQWLCVFATVDESRSLAGLTAFYIPTTIRGFHVSAVLPVMGLRGCPLVEFYLENAAIPREHMLTAEGEAHSLVQALSAYGRCQAAAIAVGIARGAFEMARQHTLTRVQGGGPILQHQMVQHLLADMAMQIEAARLLVHKAAAAEPPDASLSAMAKVFASDAAVQVTSDAVQLMGAYGTTMKSGAEKYLRDAKMTQILEGTNMLCRLTVTAPMLHDAGLGSCSA